MSTSRRQRKAKAKRRRVSLRRTGRTSLRRTATRSRRSLRRTGRRKDRRLERNRVSNEASERATNPDGNGCSCTTSTRRCVPSSVRRADAGRTQTRAGSDQGLSHGRARAPALRMRFVPTNALGGSFLWQPPLSELPAREDASLVTIEDAGTVAYALLPSDLHRAGFASSLHSFAPTRLLCSALRRRQRDACRVGFEEEVRGYRSDGILRSLAHVGTRLHGLQPTCALRGSGRRRVCRRIEVAGFS